MNRHQSAHGIRRRGTNVSPAIAIVGLMMCATMAAATKPSQPEQVEQSEKIIKLQSVIDLPGGPSGAAWSPDGNKLLIDWPINKDGVSKAYFVDVETKDISEFFYTLKNGLDDFYWSPNGKVIAVTRSTVVRFLRYPELTLIGEVRAPRTDAEFCAFNTDNGAQFTADSRALWVACKERFGRKTSSEANAKYQVALKIDVAAGTITDRFSVPLPEPRMPYVRSFRSSISLSDGEPILNMIFRTALNLVEQGKPKIKYLANYGLQSKAPLYPPIDTSGLQIAGYPTNFPLYSSGQKTITCAFAQGGMKRVGGRWEGFTDFSTLAVIDPELKSSTNTQNIPKKFRDFSISRLAYFPDHTSIVGSITDLKTPEGYTSGLGVWRSSDLELLQIEPTPTQYWGKLSPDGRHYAVLSGPKLFLYVIRD